MGRKFKNIAKNMEFQENSPKPTVKQLTTEQATPSNDTLYLTYGNYYPNPDPVVRQVGGVEGITLYDRVLEDDHAFSVLNTRWSSVIRHEWCVEPPSNALSREKKIAQFVEDTLYSSNFDFMCYCLLKSILYGYYGAEVIYKYNSSSQLVIDRFVPKHPRRFAFDSNRQLRLLTINDPIYGVTLPGKKFIIMQYGDTDDPYGIGLGRTLHWLVWFKHTQVKWWNKYAEKFACPTVVANTPDMNQASAIAKALESIQTSTNIVIPEQVKITLVEANRGNNSYQAACDFFNRGISKAVLGQVLTTESNTTGTYALGKVQETVRQDILQFDSDMLDEVLNATIIKWLVDLNFSLPTDRYPKIVRYTNQKLVVNSLLEKAQIDKIIVGDLGIQVDPSYFYETYSLPAPEKG